MNCTDTLAALGSYLNGSLPEPQITHTQRHLDQCDQCWRSWNRLRWDAAAPTPLYAELVEYLGDRFTPYLDSSRNLAIEWDQTDPRTPEQIRSFYRTTDAYLYNQVIWHASGNRPATCKEPSRSSPAIES